MMLCLSANVINDIIQFLRGQLYPRTDKSLGSIFVFQYQWHRDMRIISIGSNETKQPKGRTSTRYQSRYKDIGIQHKSMFHGITDDTKSLTIVL